MKLPSRVVFGVALVVLGPLALLVLPETFWPRASAQLELSGEGFAIDGDTLEVNRTRVRLFGIDAPEDGQTCKDERGTPWPCGKVAGVTLDALISGKTLACHKQDVDSYGRVVAICYAGNTDIGAEMVRAGMAIAFVRYSTRYSNEEMAARLARRGMWVGSFVAPEQHRRAKR